MITIDFFTAVKYNDSTSKLFSESILELVDDYFYLGGKKAHVIGTAKDGKIKAVLSETNISELARIAKIVSYATLIIPTLLLLAKAALRLTYSFKLIDPRLELEKNIDISENTLSKIQALLPRVLKEKDDEEINWLAKYNNLVFSLTDLPNLVFKIASKTSESKANSEKRFANMIKAKEVCLINRLGLLIIPKAKKIEIEVDNEQYTFIVEERLDIDKEESIQEELYHTHAKDLNETARQLAIFIAKTGFNDVAWRNIPILNEAQDFIGPRKIALIDLEHMQNTVSGFSGDYLNHSRGLIRCVSETQIDIVIAEARTQGVPITDEQVNNAKAWRIQELQSDENLRLFHEQNRIINGKEPIQVELGSLGLDLTEEGGMRILAKDKKGRAIREGSSFKWDKQTVTLGKVAEDVIEEINRLIQNSPDQASKKFKRHLLLDIRKDPLIWYKNLHSKKDKNHTWLNQIIQALVDKGYIHKIDRIDHQGYFIQA